MKYLLTLCLFAFSVSAWAGDAPASAPAADTPKAGETIKVEKAVGDNAYTVAEIVARRADLKDKTVLVRGKVVKFNGNIMKKNWVHLRDGSGSEADGSNDILITTDERPAVGEVVTMKGVVRADKDFGYGYNYDVMLEEGATQK